MKVYQFDTNYAMNIKLFIYEIKDKSYLRKTSSRKSP